MASKSSKSQDKKKDKKKTGSAKKPGVSRLKKGDQVSWRSHGKRVVGVIKKRITKKTKAGGRRVKASKAEPQYLVKSDKTGATAVHKPTALKLRRKKG